MKRTLLLLAVILSGHMFAQDLPEHNPNLYVTDLANIFSDSEERSLDQHIRSYKDKTTSEFAVATVPSLQGQTVAEFGNLLFKKWGIGTREHNNGVLILIAPSERKWRIEVGYGMEQFLTDGYTKNVADESFKPNFKKGDYFTGVDVLLANFMDRVGYLPFAQTVDNYKKTQAELAAQQAAAAERQRVENQQSMDNFMTGFYWFLGIGALVGIMVFFGMREARRKREAAEALERIRMAEEIKTRRIQELKRKINELRDYRSHNQELVDKISNFKYDIGQGKLKDTFETDCKEVEAEPVVENESELDLQTRYNKLCMLVKESEISMQKLNNDMNKAIETERAVLDLPKSINTLRQQLNDSLEVHESICKKYPHELTRELKDISKVMGLLNDATMAHTEAENELRAGRVAKAANCVEQIKVSLIDTNSYLRSPYDLRDRIKQAELVVSRANTDIEMLVLNAKGHSGHSDVSRSSAASIDEVCRMAGLFLKEKMGLNPISNASNINKVKDSINNAIKSAESDIRRAEAERERVREEERQRKRRIEEDARRRREEEEDDRRRRNSYSSSSPSSSYSSSDSSSSSGSSFGGGDSGGGDSGGGGSSGGW